MRPGDEVALLPFDFLLHALDFRPMRQAQQRGLGRVPTELTLESVRVRVSVRGMQIPRSA